MFVCTDAIGCILDVMHLLEMCVAEVAKPVRKGYPHTFGPVGCSVNPSTPKREEYNRLMMNAACQG